MMDFNIILQNNDFLLRPIQTSDLEHFWILTKSTSIWKYTPLDLSIRNEFEEWFYTGINQYFNKTRLPFTIVDKKNNKIIGSTSFGNISEIDKRIEIGWTWLETDSQGKRINDQVKYLMIQYCFDDLNYERVEFKTDVLNTYARTALLRIGATEEGILRSHSLMTNNRRRDTIYYSVLKTEWKIITCT